MWVQHIRGKIHDLKMLREDDPDLGQITELAKAGDTPEDKRPKCLSDLGYKKIDGFYPGADHKQPHKKEKNGKLTKRQKQIIGRRRVKVEHVIGKLMRYRILGRPFDGTIKQFDLTMSILTGLANLKTLWNRKKQAGILTSRHGEHAALQECVQHYQITTTHIISICYFYTVFYKVLNLGLARSEYAYILCKNRAYPSRGLGFSHGYVTIFGDCEYGLIQPQGRCRMNVDSDLT